MPMRRESWQEKHRRAVSRKPWIRLERVRVKHLGPRGGYEVVIEGVNLHPAISPPRVTVGGVPLEHPEFQRDGRSIRGVLPKKPTSGRVVVDYGFARAELKGLEVERQDSSG